MVAIKHGVALLVLLAVLGLSTAFAQQTKKRSQPEGLVSQEEAKKVVEVWRPNLPAKLVEKQTKRIVHNGQKILAQRKKANQTGRAASSAEIADYKKHSSKRYGYDHKDSYKHHDYAPKGDYYPKGDYPSGYGGDYYPGYGGYGPPPVTPEEDFYIEVYFDYRGSADDTDITPKELNGYYYAYWEAEEPSAGDPYYKYWYTYYEKYPLMVAESVEKSGPTASDPQTITVRGYYTDHETTVSCGGACEFTDEGYQYYETYGTYPSAFSVKNWKIDGTIVPDATACFYECPGGGTLDGTVVEVSTSPFGETTVVDALDPIWRKPFHLVCSFGTQTC